MALDSLVSILLPAYDAEATLEDCLRSVERQTRRQWECVIVDDGSADGTAAIADEHARRDGRFRVLSRPHQGLVAALSAGLAVCRGELVARMDADDVMHRRRLELQVAALNRHPEWVAVGSHVRLFPRRLLGRGYREYEAWLNAVDGLPIAHDRLSRVLIMIGDALDCIKKTDHVDTLFYCDPPYLPETRSSPGSYGPHEMTLEQHQDLLDLLATIKGKFMLSGYPSEMYAAMAKKHGWNSVEVLIPNQASSKKVKDIKKEVVWMNYALELAA